MNFVRGVNLTKNERDEFVSRLDDDLNFRRQVGEHLIIQTQQIQVI